MKIIIVGAFLFLALAVQSALADEGTMSAKPTDGTAIAEQRLLREDLKEVAPAKEEKSYLKKQSASEDGEGELREAPLTADGVTSENISDNAVASSGGDAAAPTQALDSTATTDQADDGVEKSAPGSLEYEMATVSLLADAPAAPPAGEKLAKR